MADSNALTRIHDRLLATSNENVLNVLNALLPKVIPLSNQDELREKVLQILSVASRRIKSADLKLNLINLLRLVHADYLPYACNLAITFLDFAITNRLINEEGIGQVILNSIQSFPAFSVQSNALCYYSLYMIQDLSNVPTEILSNCTKALHILGDYMIDVCLLQLCLEKDKVGSIQSGLSIERVNRLTLKRSVWSSVHIKEAKLNLIDNISKKWLPLPYNIIISIICAYDSEHDVSQQSSFKMRGSRDLFELSETNFIVLLRFLCQFVANDFDIASLIREDLQCHHHLYHNNPQTDQRICDECDYNIRSDRSILKEDMRMSILSYVHTYLYPEIKFFMRPCMILLYGELNTFITGSSAGNANDFKVMAFGTVRYITSLVSLMNEALNESIAEALLEALPIIQDTIVSTLLKCVTVILRPFIASQTLSSKTNREDSRYLLTLRATMYKLVTSLCRRLIVFSNSTDRPEFLIDENDNGTRVTSISLMVSHNHMSTSVTDVIAQLISDIDFILLLFRSVENETEDNQTLLFSCLEAYRELFQYRSSSAIALELKPQFEEIIKRIRSSSFPKVRVLSLLWVKVLLGPCELYFNCLITLSSDADPYVASVVKSEYTIIFQSLSSERTDIGSLVKIIHSFLSQLRMPISSLGIFYILQCCNVGISSLFIRLHGSKCDGSWSAVSLQSCEDSVYGSYDRDTLQTLILCQRFFHLDPTIEFVINWSNHNNVGIDDEVIPASLREMIASIGRVIETLSSFDIFNNMNTNDPSLFQPTNESEMVSHVSTSIDMIASYRFNPMNLNITTMKFIRSSMILFISMRTKVTSTLLVQTRAVITNLVLKFLNQEKDSKAAMCNGPDPVAMDDLEYLIRLSSHCVLICAADAIRARDSNYLSLLLRSMKQRVLEKHNASFVECEGALTGLGCLLTAFTCCINSSAYRNEDELDRQFHTLILNIANQLKNDMIIWLTSILCHYANDDKDDCTMSPMDLSDAFLIKHTVKILNDWSSLHKNSFLHQLFVDLDDAVLRKGLENLILLGFAVLKRCHTKYAPNPRSNASSTHSETNTNRQPNRSLSSLHETITASLCEFLSHIIISESIAYSESMLNLVWFQLWDVARTEVMSIEVQYCVGESIVRILLWHEGKNLNLNEGVQLNTVLSLLEQTFVHRVMKHFNAKSNLGSSVVNEDFAVTLLLILIKQSTDVLKNKVYMMERMPTQGTTESSAMTLDRNTSLASLLQSIIPRLTEIFLRYLQLDDVFVQDLSAIGLSYAFYSARIVDFMTEMEALNHKDDAFSTETKSSSLCDRIASDVIGTLTREKKLPLPAGMAVAGEASGTSQLGEISRFIERILHGPASNIEGDAPNQANRDRGRTGTPLSRDGMMAAANTAAQELGLDPQELATAMGQVRAQAGAAAPPDRAVTDSGFGLYTNICKILRKSGERFIIFVALSLTQYDDSMKSMAQSSRIVHNLVQCYQAPQIDIHVNIRHLIPVLYCAKFNLSEKIQNIVEKLWQRSISDDGKITALLLKQYASDICAHIQLLITSKNWRERESACLAGQQLLKRLSWMDIKSKFSDLWDAGFCVLDDIKDTTRKAGLGLMKALADIAVKTCGCDDGDANEVIELILPRLLNQGLLAPSLEGKGFSLDFISRLVETVGTPLRNWRAKIIGLLAESLSAFEPAMLQYMQFHTSRLNIQSAELDKLRLQLSQDSPMNKVLDNCLKQLIKDSAFDYGDEIMIEVTYELLAQLTRGVGLATRVAALNSLCFITESAPNKMKRHGVKPFRAILMQLLTVSSPPESLEKALVNAIGTLAKVLSVDVIVEACRSLVNKYDNLNRNDAELSLMIAACLRQLVVKVGSEIPDEALWLDILARSYLGQFESSNSSRELWCQVWNEALIGSNTGTKSSALTKALPITVMLIERLLCDRFWSKRTQALNAIQDILSSLSSQLNSRLAPYCGNLVRILLVGAFGGNLWRGKALWVDTLAAIVSRCSDRIRIEYPPDQLFVIDTRSKENIGLESQPNGDGGGTPMVVLKYSDLGSNRSLHEEVVQSQLDFDLSMEQYAEVIIQHEAMRQVTRADDTSEMTPPFQGASFADWFLSAEGILNLFFHEAQISSTRDGDSDYRFVAARACLNFPWNIIIKNEKILYDKLPLLYNLANIDMAMYENESISVTPVEEHSLSMKLTSSPDDAITAPTKESTLSRESKSQQMIKRKVQYNNVFGSRYGKPTFSAPTKRPATSTNLRRRESESIGIISRTANPDDGMKSIPPIAISEEVKTSTMIAMDIEEPSDASNTEVSPSIIMNETIPVVETTIRAAVKYNFEPAYHMTFIDCLATIFSRFNDIDSNEVTASHELFVTQTSPKLIRWAVATVSSQVWSIKRSVIHLLGMIFLSWRKAFIHSDMMTWIKWIHFDSIIVILETSVDDTKYAKLRAAAYDCLNDILRCDIALIILHQPQFEERIKTLLLHKTNRLQSNPHDLQEQNPDVLTSIEKARMTWKLLNHKR